jgi:hypothetical protein
MGRRPKGECPVLKGYSRTGTINFPLVAKYVREIKSSRSQQDLSKRTTYSTSAISQILNCKLSNIEPDFVQAIWDSREENCTLTEEEFLAAFGFTKNLSAEQFDESTTEHKRRSLEIQPLQTSDSTRNICQNALLAHKYPILETKINYPLDNNLDKKIIIDFSIHTKTLEEQVIEWIVKIVPNSIVEARNFFETLFATLYVQDSDSTIMRYSVVITDRKVFRTLKEVYQHVTVDDYISIILIDNKRQAVADEFIMPRRNTQNDVKSLFT